MTGALLVVIAVGVWVMAVESVVFAVQRFGRWRRERSELRAAAQQLRAAVAARRLADGRGDDGIESIETGPLV